MLLTYENRSNKITVEWKSSTHVPPHLHEAMEIIYVTEGTVELGVGQELHHMNTGDFAIVFPNVIHHYQVFGGGENKVMYLFAEQTLFPSYVDGLQKYSPQLPVICKENVHPDIVNAMIRLADFKEYNDMLVQAYVQIILAHVFSEMKMVEKETVGGNDIIYNAVEYVAKKFREEICLDKMACDLGVSKYVLSRMFSKTFHCNFSQYVNGVRLNYATSVLENTQESITNICLDCGFESQRTFNRVFKERYKMTPRDYRNRSCKYKREDD
ncbi:MAG: helix-turn-helix domain-containing protein [Lachnospiraceae bacterium]|nr:helix-turn-helix domain-containing protein [Lachnospiraceae bacterium]